MEQLLIISGASIYAILGSAHLIFTFLSNKFHPFHMEARQAMEATSPKITKETSMWRAWIGFNASHSLGAILLAAIYIPLALENIATIQSSIWLQVLPLLFSFLFMILAKLYWFKVPFIGASIATLMFGTAFFA